MQQQQQQQVQQQQQASSSPPQSLQQQQQQSFSFAAASASFKLPVHCLEVALTQDGRSLLVAAGQHGLIDLNSSSGHELSRWWPPKRSSSDLDDSVLAVAVLIDGRAVVSLHYAQLIVLLRHSEKSSGSSNTGQVSADVAPTAAGDDAWIEDCRIQLPWPAYCLSADGDVLAASYDQQLRILSLNSRRLWLSDTKLRCGYGIGSLVVAAQVVVTGSSDKVNLGGGHRAAHVLDAYSLHAGGSSDKILWRNVLSSSSSIDGNQQEEEVELWSVCADSSGGCLYAAVCRSDNSSGRVSALSLADGSELRRVALSSHSAASTQLLLLPRWLSLCDVRAAEQGIGSTSRSAGGRVLLLAVLCWNPATEDRRTVTLHRSTSEMLQ